MHIYNSIKHRFDFEAILNNKEEHQGWSEMLLRPYKSGKKIPTDFYLRQLNKEQLLQTDLSIFRQLQHIQKENNFNRLSVNLMPSSLSSIEFRKEIIQLVLTQKILPSALCIEILEQQNLTNIDQDIIMFLNFLRNRGCLVALDDFGTGSAHWKLLQYGIIDVIKIANQKLKKSDPEIKKNYINGLFKFADSMQLETVLEGIETPADLEMGKSMGFNNFQGWLFKNTKSLDHNLQELAHEIN